MNKWISIKNGGEYRCMLNAALIQKIGVSETANGKPRIYYLIFRDQDKEQAYVSYTSRKHRDREYTLIHKFINCNDDFILYLESDSY